MKGLVVNLNNDTVKDKARLFSRLIWKLIRPEYLSEDVTTELFRRVKHPTLNLGVLLFDENYTVQFNIYKEDGSFKTRSIAIIEELVDILYPNATASKKTQIRNYVKNNAGATIEQLLPNKLPNGLEIKTYTELESDGWFPEFKL